MSTSPSLRPSFEAQEETIEDAMTTTTITAEMKYDGEKTTRDVKEIVQAQTEGEGAEEGKEEMPISEYETAEDQVRPQEEHEDDSRQSSATPQEQKPFMSPEHALLLQVLRRAKRQQDLIIQVQKSLKLLANIEKSTDKTALQINKLQSAVKDSQKQIVNIQRQIGAVERVQERNYQRLAKQQEKPKSGAVARAKANARHKKTRSKKE